MVRKNIGQGPVQLQWIRLSYRGPWSTAWSTSSQLLMVLTRETADAASSGAHFTVKTTEVLAVVACKVRTLPPRRSKSTLIDFQNVHLRVLQKALNCRHTPHIGGLRVFNDPRHSALHRPFTVLQSGMHTSISHINFGLAMRWQ